MKDERNIYEQVASNGTSFITRVLFSPCLSLVKRGMPPMGYVDYRNKHRVNNRYIIHHINDLMDELCCNIFYKDVHNKV